MLLAERCSHEFSSKIRSRGEGYFRGGRVRLDSTDDGIVWATVSGSTDYEVLLDWSEAADGVVSASCECPHFSDGFFCKHLWATMLAVDESGLTANLRGKKRLYLYDPDPEEDWSDDGWGEEDLEADDDWAGVEEESAGSVSVAASRRLKALGQTGSAAARFAQPSASSGRGSWKRQLESIPAADVEADPLDLPAPLTRKRCEAWYVLDITASVAMRVPMLKLFQRQTKKNGEPGKIKSLSVYPGQLDRFVHREDREALSSLLMIHNGTATEFGGGGYWYGYARSVSEVPLTPDAIDFLLPKLTATGRFVWILDSSLDVAEEGRPVRLGEGEPWRFQVCIEPDKKKKHWEMTGRLIRDGGRSSVSLDQPVLMMPGFVLFEDRLDRLDAAEQFPWMAVLRREQSIRVPVSESAELVDRLWQAPSVPETILPDELRWEEVQIEPRGRLRIQSPNSFLRQTRLGAEVSFDYEGREVSVRSNSTAVVDREARQVLHRDREKERRLLDELIEAGLLPVGEYYGFRGKADLEVPQRKLSEIVERLAGSGWIVEAEGHRIRRPGEYRLNVVSGTDWFELDGSFDFDGTSVKLPELLAALRSGEKYVSLDDGSKGLLPEEWLSRFAALADLGESTDEGVRFRPSQTLLLDSLLASQETTAVSWDRRFAGLRRKLRSFRGISARREPRGFVGTLREYQKRGLGWLHFLREFGFGGCLADDMGLGKTIQVLALLQSRRTRRKDADGRRPPSLAVVPKSLVFNWIDEASRFTPKLRVVNYTGRDRKALLEHLDEYDLLVTTYGTLRRDIAELKDVRFDYAILDEGQAIKNASSQAAKACRLIDAEHRLALTGTPVENHLGELWSLFEFLNPGMLGRSSAFQRAVRRTSNGSPPSPLPEGEGGEVRASNGQNGSNGGRRTHGEALKPLAQAVAPFLLRRTKEEVLTELPEKTEQTLYCDLVGKQRRQYEELKQYYRSSLSRKIEDAGMAKAKIHVLEALLRLRQAACHPGLLDRERTNDRSAKLDLLMEQLAEIVDEGHKALAFSQFTSLLSILRRRLDEENVVYEYLDGRTRKRQTRVKRFQEDPQCPLFLISLKAGGHGLNLTAADYVYILDPWWNPAVEAQAIDRTHRIGQTRRVFAYRIIARETVEEKILELQREKRDLAEAIVGGNESLLRSLTADDLQRLLS